MKKDVESIDFFRDILNLKYTQFEQKILIFIDKQMIV